MFPFGLFDLLKTLLPSPDQTTQNPPTADNGTEADGAPSSSPVPSSLSPSAVQKPTVSEAEKPNACADFLYRHEQRSRGVKGTKKRLD